MNPMFRAIPIRFVFWLCCAVSANAGGMILELGGKSHFIQVTPEYSNAVLAATLPAFSEFAGKLELPVPHPIKAQDVVDCRILPYQDKNGGIAGVNIVVRGGIELYFYSGFVRGFSRGNTYHGLQDPDEIPKFYGQVKMTEAEAVQLARNTLKKLGIPLEDAFADREPEVTLPPQIGTNIVSRYQIEWMGPHGGGAAPGIVRMEVNAETKQVESLLFSTAENLMRPSPKVNVVPPKGHGMFDSQMPPPVNPEYAWKLIPIMFKAIDEYGEKLSLPIPRPLTTNVVSTVGIYNNGGWPHCEIKLTNGWRFVYRHCMVNGYYAPTTFFDNQDRPFHVKDFDGKWNLNTNQAIELVKKTLAKLNYPTNNIHMGFAPTILYAAGDFRKIIPRYFFWWNYLNAAHDDLQSKVEAEVNADTGKLESLYYDDKAYWDCRPPIDAPISTGKYTAIVPQ